MRRDARRAGTEAGQKGMAETETENERQVASETAVMLRHACPGLRAEQENRIVCCSKCAVFMDRYA